MSKAKQTLKQLRSDMGITQKEAAKRLEVSHDTIKRWESGRTFPTAPDILKICALYSTTFDRIEFEAQTESEG